MGGHGGLNILPQKRWNVYNYENREKVRKDEEAAAKEEQLKREQSRKRDTEFRLEQLRQARGLASTSSTLPEKPEQPESKSNHINLFEGIKIFDPIRGEEDDEKRGKFKKLKKEAVKEVKVMLPEDEKYKLGYGLVGKGVKLPWYMSKKRGDEAGEGNVDDGEAKEERKSSSGKKTLEELREERLKRERREKERARELIRGKGNGPRDGPAYKDRYYTR